MKRKAISLSLILVLVLVTLGTQLVGAESLNFETSVPKSDVVNSLIENNSFTKNQKAQIKNDIDTLEKCGVPIDLVEKAFQDEGKIKYEVVYANDLIDEITVEEGPNGEILLDIIEGDIHNTVVISDNDIYIDGKKVEYTLETNLVDAEKGPRRVVGVTYTQTAPSEVKSWGSYSLNWTCSNINLQSFLKDLSVSTIITVIAKHAGVLADLVSSFITTTANYLKSNEPYSKGISFKMWCANSSNPITSRYVKHKRIGYGKVNFSGASRTDYFYSIKG